MTATRPVVVGVDGSEAGFAALDWAVGEAVVRGGRLRVIHAYHWHLSDTMTLGFYAAFPPVGRPQEEAQRVVDQAVRRACMRAAGLLVEGQIVAGAAAHSLLREAQGADLMVVGSRGLGGFTGLLLGSVSLHLAHHSPCPVVVTRAVGRHVDRPLGDRVIVGVDDPLGSAATIEFACAEGRRLGVPVRLVSVVARLLNSGAHTADDHAKVEERRHELETAVGDWQTKCPEVSITYEVRRGSPGYELVSASSEARLMVVGARGVGGFRGLRLGSVSQQVLHQAVGPVAIVPHDLET